MKLICPRCQYQALFDASADDGLTSCARCGAPLDQQLWPDSPLTPLTRTTAAATTAVVDQRIMKNQNAYAPSAESVGDDVLEIPRPLKSTQSAGEQMPVLEDVIPVPPAQDLSGWDDDLDPDLLDVDEDETLLLEEDESDSLPLAAAGLEESDPQTRSEILGVPQASAVDYEGYRAWIRIAPLLLLVGALVFFTLYYLGNRMGAGDRAQNAATNPAPPETPGAVPGGAPENVQTAPSQPAESSVVGAKAESPSPGETLKVETTTPQEAAPPAHEAPPATHEAPPPPTEVAAPIAAPTAAPSVVASPVVTQSAPVVASQDSGNYTIQVGSYNNAAQAEERVARLASSGVEARVVRAEIPRRGTWYRVQTGRFASNEEAARYGAQLKGKGATDDFIITSAQSQ